MAKMNEQLLQSSDDEEIRVTRDETVNKRKYSTSSES